MKRTTQIVVDTISAQEAADHLALLSDNLMDAVELKTDLSQSDLAEKEREKEEKEFSDSDDQPAIQLASAGGIVDVPNAAMIDLGSEVDQQTYESYADETGGGSSGISPWLAIGGGVLAVAGIVALADSDDDDNNNNNDDNNNGGDPGDGDDDDDTPTPNNAPTFASVPDQTVIENGEVTFTVNANDPDGDDLVFSAGSPTNGTVTQTISGTFKYEPNPDYSGGDTFTVSVSDGRGGTDIVAVNITITEAPNEDPFFVDIDGNEQVVREVATDENTDVIISLRADDPDEDDELTFELPSLTTEKGGIVEFLEGSTDKVVYTPKEDYLGTDDFFKVIVKDGNGGTATQTINMRVDVTDTAPANVVPDDLTTDKNTPTPINELSVSDSADDNDDDEYTVTLTVTEGTLDVGGTATLPDNGTSTVTLTGTLTEINDSLSDVTYTPKADFVGPDSLTITTNEGDDGLRTDTDSITITVTETPAEIGGNLDGSVTENSDTTDVTGTLSIEDRDFGDDVFQAQTATEGTYGTFDLVEDGNNWTYTLDNTDPDTDALKEGQEVQDTFSIQSADGTTETVTITVTGTNDDPTAEDDEATVDEDGSVTINVIDNDADPEGELANSTFTEGTGPSHGQLTNNNDGTFTYTPDANYNGDDSFTYTITDPEGGTDTATVSISVEPVVDQISLDPQKYYLTNGSAVTVGIDVENPDDTALTYTVLTNPQFGTLDVSGTDSEYVYTPNAGFIGRDTIRVRVTNGESDPVFQVVNIFVDEETVNGVILDAADEEQNGSSGDDRYYGVLGNSSDSDALNLTTFTTGDSIFASLGTDTLFLDISAHEGGLDDSDFSDNLSNLEVLKLGQGDNLVSLGANAEGAGIRTVIGNSGEDTLDVSDYTSSSVGVELLGGDGNDTIVGSQGDDLLVGGDGDDDITAGEGSDVIGGLAGNDTIDLDELTAELDEVHFGVGTGSDTVVNFDVNGDLIVFLDNEETSGASIDFANSMDTKDGPFGTAIDSADWFEFADETAFEDAAAMDAMILEIIAGPADVNDLINEDITNSYLYFEDSGDTKLYFDADWGDTDGRELIASFVDVSVADLDSTDFGVYTTL